MADKNVKNMIGNAFLDIAKAIETGDFGGKIRVGLTTLGSELGVENLVKGAEAAASDGTFEVVLIGEATNTKLEVIEATCEADAAKKMEDLIDSGYIAGCVTLHYSFDIGTSTVGRVITPALGNEMLISTTTGTSDTDRTVGMIKNAIYGIVTAKALGNENPTVGILNVDNARGVERALKKMKDNGYDINFGTSGRADGGSVLRGNDIMLGSVDVMVTDSLTGNILMKLLSSYTTGGKFEAVGYGYGPGIAFDSKRIINIISRASGAPVIANALKYVAGLAKGNLIEKISKEYEAVKKAGFEDIINDIKKPVQKSENTEPFEMPAKEVVTSEIGGIDILDLDDAVEAVLRAGIYAESGMGCTGPLLLVNPANLDKAKKVLVEKDMI